MRSAAGLAAPALLTRALAQRRCLVQHGVGAGGSGWLSSRSFIPSSIGDRFAMPTIRPERLTATLEGDFVVFLIGMRINHPWKLHQWLPVAQAMPRMLRELYQQPELGFLHAETWFARTIIVVQYWRSMEQLLAYAKNRDAAHLPAWKAFNQRVGTNGAVGIWHETYAASAGSYENVYVNMPAFGLGQAGVLQPASGGRQSAAGRMRVAAAGSGTVREDAADDPQSPIPKSGSAR